MLKVVGIVGLALAAFAGAVIASAAAAGKLNQESLDYLLGRAEAVEREPDAAPASVPAPDEAARRSPSDEAAGGGGISPVG